MQLNQLFNIVEAKQVGLLYHYIDHNNLIDDVLKQDNMPPGKFWIPLATGYKEGKPTFIQQYGVSLTRHFKNRNMYRWYGDSMICFDGDKLSHTYKIIPREDAYLKNPHYTKHHYNQAEEFVVAPKGIPNVSQYIVKIYIPSTWLEMYMRPGELFDERELLSKFNVEAL